MMGEDNAAAVLAGYRNSDRVTEKDVKRMRAAVYADGIVSRAEAEMMFAVAGVDTETCPAWHAFFVEAITDHIVHQETARRLHVGRQCRLADRSNLAGTASSRR